MAEKEVRVHQEDLRWKTTEDYHELFDAEGEILGNLPLSFTEDQIRAAVCFANDWYTAGLEHGQRKTQAHMRAVLGIVD